jgi:putative chitinase
MTITGKQLNDAGLVWDPSKADEIALNLNDAFELFEINTNERIAGFLSQVCHESDRFRLTVENLNYSAAGLLEVWPKRMTPELAAKLAHNPVAIGNHMYADRNGNGPESSGDGFKYRGRGDIQVTGKANYDAFGKAVGENFVANPDLVASTKYAVLSAAWFWETHGLNELADKKDIVGMTKRVNGGTNGLKQRTKFYEAACKVFCS